MRLINTKTLRLKQFPRAAQTPPYAILSHTWGDGEVSLQSFQNKSFRFRRKGFKKIESACQEAHRQGLEYLWADTCCIDKTSSAELSEAINSMFQWYKRSQICYAFCEDVGQSSINSQGIPLAGNLSRTEFAASRWFTRGWTLQELIAPKEVVFYNKNWMKIGEKSSSSQLIADITGIDTFVLEGGPLSEASVGRRMSWAVDRQTTREEDTAYSLMGLFDINMPLLYGEGPKAFIRLQEEILRQSDDHTLFAWRSPPESTILGRTAVSGLLADHPRNFRNFGGRVFGNTAKIQRVHADHRDHIVKVWDHRTLQHPITITNKGICFISRLVDLHPGNYPDQFMILILNCSPGGNAEQATGIYIRRQYEDQYARVRTAELANIRLSHGDPTMHTIHCLKAGKGFDQPWTTSLDIRQESLASSQLQGQQFDGSTALRQRYQDALQLCRSSFKASTIFDSYILYGVGTRQAHGAWRFFRFDSYGEGEDAIFSKSPGRELALLFHTLKDLDLVVVTLSIDTATGNHLVNAVYVDEGELAREGADIAKILNLKGTRELSRAPQSCSSSKRVLVAGGALSITVWVKHILIGDIPMRRIHLSGPWPASWVLILRTELFGSFFIYFSISFIIGLSFTLYDVLGSAT